MNWFTTYALSSLIVPAVAGAIAHEWYEFELNPSESGHFIGLAIGCLLWPITGALLLYGNWEVMRAKSAERGIAQALELCGLGRDNDRRQGRNPLVEAKESDLKFLVKKYRQGYTTNIKSADIEAIRNELLQRNMERNLLR